MSRYDRQKRRILMRMRQLFPEKDCFNIRKPYEKIFVIAGTKVSTKEDVGQWTKNGEPIDFEYFDKTIVASGNTMHEVIRSAQHHIHLREITTNEYLKARSERNDQDAPLKKEYLKNALEKARETIEQLEDLKNAAGKVVASADIKNDFGETFYFPPKQEAIESLTTVFESIDNE